jgi:hypothetical protein
MPGRWKVWISNYAAALGWGWGSYTSPGSNLLLLIPYAPCMVYLPTFGWFLGHMLINIPYMEHMGITNYLKLNYNYNYYYYYNIITKSNTWTIGHRFVTDGEFWQCHVWGYVSVWCWKSDKIDWYWYEWSCFHTERCQKNVLWKMFISYKRSFGILKWSDTINDVKPFETVLRYLYAAGWEIVQNRSKPFRAIYNICCRNSVEPFQGLLRYLWVDFVNGVNRSRLVVPTGPVCCPSPE